MKNESEAPKETPETIHPKTHILIPTETGTAFETYPRERIEALDWALQEYQRLDPMKTGDTTQGKKVILKKILTKAGMLK